MRNIEFTKKRYLNFFALKYYNKSEDKLTDEELSRCKYLAELWAYIYNVVPEGYGEYTIFDFDGFVVNKKDAEKQNCLLPEIAKIAKDKVCQFCWNLSWEVIKDTKIKNPDNIMEFLRKNNIMLDRFKNGNNAVIYGASEKPIGRTMIASIIMKEAIKLRAIHNERGHTYDWVDFSKLIQDIDKDTNDLVDYKACDWLVVDNITQDQRSSNQRTFFLDLINPFFIERYNNNLPTILVFKFDIMGKSLSMGKLFGIGINRIIESDKTFKIPLEQISIETIGEINVK